MFVRDKKEGVTIPLAEFVKKLVKLRLLNTDEVEVKRVGASCHKIIDSTKRTYLVDNSKFDIYV